ncbi:MAG: tetratricopeptide repeat protein [Myxococcales bacterium]|nr:tetratricopeptide repeat protein [Myxococcales bacterium]
MKKLRGTLTLTVAVVWAALLGATAAAADPTEIQELYRRSYQLEAQARPADALDAVQQIRAKAGPSYFALARSAWLAYLAGRHDVAESSYRAAAFLKPKALEPLLGLTAVLLVESKWRELEQSCAAVLQLDPRNALARARLAHAYYSLGNYPDAATVYRELVEEYPGNLDHQTGLAWALARMGNVADAKARFADVLAVSPDNPNALAGMTLP